MAVRFIQLKFIEPDILLNAGVLSVNKKITAPVPMEIRIYQGRLEVGKFSASLLSSRIRFSILKTQIPILIRIKGSLNPEGLFHDSYNGQKLSSRMLIN